MKDREYLYTVDVRRNGKWTREQHVATSMVEVSRILSIKLDDLHYITKEIVK